ncbi:hypothetical protein DH2020_000397 [Rehmannia glutinosa]|uniref:NADP-dependent oxidoreductase domain-containing protein n=1 Tax=Rehmannia glutinosa TaxID=99300 RepID=A0ABR0XWG2_REHGL
MAATAMSVHQFISNLNTPRPRGGFRWSKRVNHRVVRCCETAVEVAEKRKTVVKNGNDSLEICRVLNGMWQTSGGWGRIDRDDAVEAMLRYADAGLSTFDMADHCIVVNGMWQTSGGWGRIDRDNAVEALLQYADAGLNTFDLADIYGPAEDLYGIFINRVRRERPPEYLENVRGWDYANSGYLDALKHLTDLKEEGKIKTVALTNFDTERLQKILENGIPVVSNQVQHSIVDMRPQQRMAELCQLSGMVDAWGGWSLFQVLLQTLKKVATKHGVTIPTVAVRYILDQQAVAGSMIGVRLGLSEHIKDANAIFSLVLDDEDVSSILEVSQKGKDLMKIIGDCGDEYRRV